MFKRKASVECCVTMFFVRVSARYCTPRSPILFCFRLSVVSACVRSVDDAERYECIMVCHLVGFESIGEMLCTFFSNFVRAKVEYGKCLYKKCRCWRGRPVPNGVTVLVVRILARCCAPWAPTRLHESLSMASVYVKSVYRKERD